MAIIENTNRKLRECGAQLIRETAKSFGVTYGANCPYSIGIVGANRFGFASIPAVAVEVYCRQRDIDAMVPIARQFAFRECASRGLPDCLKITPTVCVKSRKRRKVDTNQKSTSFGKNKMLQRCIFSFEITSRDSVALFLETLPRIYKD